MRAPSDKTHTDSRERRCNAGVAFHLGEGTVGLSTSTPEIADHVRRFLPDYAVPLHAAEPDELFWVNEDDGKWSVGLADSAIVDTFGSLRDTLNGLEQLVVTRLLAATPRTAQLHSAGTVHDDCAVLALGASGAGKTSIALRWSANGLPVLGDDLILLDNEGVASPFKRLFITEEERLSEVGACPEPNLAWLSDAKEAWYDPNAGGGWADAAPVGMIALVQYQAGAGLNVKELAKPQALSALLASLFPTGLSSSEFFGCCIDMVQHASTIELTFSESAAAAEFLVSPR